MSHNVFMATKCSIARLARRTRNRQMALPRQMWYGFSRARRTCVCATSEWQMRVQMHASKRYVANVWRLDKHAPFTAGCRWPNVVSCDGRYYALFGARSACNMNPRSLKHLPFFLGMLAIEASGQCWNTYTHSRLMDFLTTKRRQSTQCGRFFHRHRIPAAL